MIFLKIFLIYFLFCFILFWYMADWFERNKLGLSCVKRRWLYYLIQFTWGLPLNLVGCVAALIYVLGGRRLTKYGWNYCLELRVKFGLELGIFMIVPDGTEIIATSTKNHEHGHAIQNLYFGPFMIGTVCLPSAIRFWWRRWKTAMHRPLKTTYDSAWFEGMATVSGLIFIEELKRKEKNPD